MLLIYKYFTHSFKLMYCYICSTVLHEALYLRDKSYFRYLNVCTKILKAIVSSVTIIILIQSVVKKIDYCILFLSIKDEKVHIL